MYYYVDGEERFEPRVNNEDPPDVEHPVNTMDIGRASGSGTNTAGLGPLEQSLPVEGGDAGVKQELLNATSA